MLQLEKVLFWIPTEIRVGPITILRESYISLIYNSKIKGPVTQNLI
jgi:hypothetical protein